MRTQRYHPSGTGYSYIQVTRAESFRQMVFRRGCAWGSQVADLGGNCYKSSARVSNERKERHVRCAKQELCREDMLQG